MMLSQKRHRPNPSTSTASSMTGDATVNNDSGDNPTSQGPASSTVSLPAPQLTQKESTTSSQDSKISPSSTVQHSAKQVHKARSWYGSWPAPPKASASTSVARENILGGSVRSKRQSNLSQFDSKKDSDSSSIQSTVTSAGATPPKPSNKMSGPDNEAGGKPADDQEQSTNGSKPNNSSHGGPVPSEANTNGSKAKGQPEPPTSQSTTTPQRPETSAGWLSWWNRAPATEVQSASLPPPLEEEEGGSDDAKVPNAPLAETANPETANLETPKPGEPSNSQAEEPSKPQAQQPEEPASTSWFGRWASKAPRTDTATAEANKSSDAEQQTISEDVAPEDAPPATAPQTMPEPTQAHVRTPTPKAGSTWAFWSKDSPGKKGLPTPDESGEIAVMGEGSESHPAPMAEDSVSSPPEPPKEAPLKGTKETRASVKSTWKIGKRNRPLSADLDSSSQTVSGAITPQEANTTKTETKLDSSSKSIAESTSTVGSNLLLPSFTSTYQTKENPTIIKQIKRFLTGSAQPPPPNHVFRVDSPPQIRKAIAIGIHGFFPATYLRPMIGQPTGTSLRFASLCADAIRRWADANGSSVCEIEKVALEGEGKISERVDNLWKLMLNWIEHIRSADIILIASHSQGVPVSILLLEKLIDLGVITNARIGVCAMAGVSLGPFPEYQSSLLGASANELWEFGNPESQNSQKLEAALKKVLDFGSRITFIGSIDDQLVPLDSALFSPAHHPFIYRAVFIDGRTHAPDFIAHLVGFALKLRNLGIADHGLIRELSLPLAGSLYSGEGHSRLYFETAVYDLAVSHCLETTPSSRQTPPCVVRRPVIATAAPSSAGGAGSAISTQPNPYVLPWIMRGLLEEDLVKTELSGEAGQLLRQFDDWKPSTKALKDVKYRLEAVRSKL